MARTTKPKAAKPPVVTRASIDEITPDPANVRRHGERNVRPMKNLSAGMTPEKLASTLSVASKRRITPQMIEADVAAGAPAESDGSINLIRYVAWLLSNDGRRPPQA